MSRSADIVHVSCPLARYRAQRICGVGAKENWRGLHMIGGITVPGCTKRNTQPRQIRRFLRVPLVPSCSSDASTDQPTSPSGGDSVFAEAGAATTTGARLAMCAPSTPSTTSCPRASSRQRLAVTSLAEHARRRNPTWTGLGRAR